MNLLADNKVKIIVVGGWAQTLSALAPLEKSLGCIGDVSVVALDRPENELQLCVNEILSGDEEQPVILIGWSLGGNFVLRLLRHASSSNWRNRLTGIALISSNPFFIGDENWPGVGVKQFSQFVEKLDHDPAGLLDHFTKLQLLGDPGFRSLLRNLSSSTVVGNTGQLRDSLYWLHDWDCREYLSGIQVPVIHLFGQKDRLHPGELPAVVEKTWPDHKSVRIDDMAHYPHEIASQHITSAIREFLAL